MRLLVVHNDFLQIIHHARHRRIVLDGVGNLIAAMQHRRVVAVAEHLPNLRQGEVRQVARDVHRDLARNSNFAAARGTNQVIHRDGVVASSTIS